MLTVACVWVQGHVPFGPEYVIRLSRNVRKHLKTPHRFVCLTDRPFFLASFLAGYAHPAFGEPAIDVIPIDAPAPNVFGWWSKMELFNPERGLTGRVMYLDLDTLPVADLKPIADYRGTFSAVPHAGNFVPKDGRRVVRRFNSSVMVFDVGEDTQDLWDYYNGEDCADRALWHAQMWGDQDLISLAMPPSARLMPLEWFPRLSEVNATDAGMSLPKHARVVLCKKPKNRDAANQWPWFDKLWGCL